MLVNRLEQLGTRPVRYILYPDNVIRLCLQLRSAALNLVCSLFLTMPVLSGERVFRLEGEGDFSEGDLGSETLAWASADCFLNYVNRGCYP